MAWLTRIGTESAGLGGLCPVKAPPAMTTISHSVLVGWSAARLERRGRAWQSARELALDPERWSVTASLRDGGTPPAARPRRLGPTLAPVALIAESGGRREDRQKMILEGWRDAVWSGKYAAVRYDCASASVAHWIARLAKKVGLIAQFAASYSDPRQDCGPRRRHRGRRAGGRREPAPRRQRSGDRPTERGRTRSRAVSPTSIPTGCSVDRFSPDPIPRPAEAAAERDRRYREIFGIDDEQPRRRWRRAN